MIHRRLFGNFVDAHASDGHAASVYIEFASTAAEPPPRRLPTPEDLYKVTLTGPPFGQFQEQGGTTWQAWTKLRERLEEHGYLIAVAAAHRDYYPTHWERNPEATTVADYRVDPSPGIGFLTDIDPADSTTVAAQEERYRTWAAHPGEQ